MHTFLNVSRHHLGKAALLVIAVLFAAIALQGHARISTAQSVDMNRAQVVENFLSAQGRGDIDGALATFAAGSVFITSFRSGVCLARTPCLDLDSIRAQLQANAALGHFCATLTSVEVAGTTVKGEVETQTDTYRAEGVAHIVSSFVAQVPQDKIAAILFVRNLGDATSALESAIAAGSQPAGAPLPAPTTPRSG